MNFARLNHILIPESREGRERFRNSLIGKLLRPVGWMYGALSLEGQAFSLLLIFVGLFGLDTSTTQIYLLWSVLAALLMASLVARPFLRLRGIEMQALPAERVTVGTPITIELQLRNTSARDVHALRVSGPFLPWDGRWHGRQPRVATLAAGGQARCHAGATFIARGEHHLDTFSLTALVPFGLALGPRIHSDSCRFMVVPRLAPVEQLDLPTSASYQQGGVAQASHVGEAMELLSVRPYRLGDPLRDLHPRTWARTGQPHVREYQQEFFTRIGVIVENDERRISEDGFEGMLSLCAGAIAKLVGGETLIDVLVVGDSVHALTVGRSLGSLNQALDVLACAKRGRSLPDEERLANLEPYLRNLSSVLVITGGDGRNATVERLSARGIPCRELRVYDDSVPFWQMRRSLRPPPAGEHTLVSLSQINAEEPLLL